MPRPVEIFQPAHLRAYEKVPPISTPHRKPYPSAIVLSPRHKPIYSFPPFAGEGRDGGKPIAPPS
jgi:hypothetical protein